VHKIGGKPQKDKFSWGKFAGESGGSATAIKKSLGSLTTTTEVNFRRGEGFSQPEDINAHKTGGVTKTTCLGSAKDEREVNAKLLPPATGC